MKKSVVSNMFTVLLFVALPGQNLLAGPGSGGGGGAYVCRSGGSIQSAELLDLFEAREASGQKIVYDENTPVGAQADKALAKLKTIHPGLAESAAIALNFIREPGHIVEASASLNIAPPLDAISNLNKSVNGVNCPLEGMMYYNDLRQRLIIKPEIFNAQKSKTEKAAAYVHEAIYKALRDDFNAETSTNARLLTGCLFSDNVANCLNLKKIVLPKGLDAWKCQDDVNSFYLVKLTEKDAVNDPNWQVIFLKSGNLVFRYETSLFASMAEPGTYTIPDYMFLDSSVHVTGLERLPVRLTPTAAFDGGSLQNTRNLIESADDGYKHLAAWNNTYCKLIQEKD